MGCRCDGVAQHGSQHVEEPCAAFVADGLVAIGEMRRSRRRPRVTGRPRAAALHLYSSLRRSRRYCSRTLGIARDSAAPGSIGRNSLPGLRQATDRDSLSTAPGRPTTGARFRAPEPGCQFAGDRIEMQIGLLLRAKKGEARQEHESRPTLAQIAWHLRQRQRMKG